ncbi:hypothetical protein LVY72_00875 [Arthrobacter sp. I2-34]|uniref:Uncharacterized protein n=1 Tax=Arthrobacter hankyongi TaxID=2904801 RepID=A0ABS9L1D7_9MICC|nr:hypothetical protein [Arthrobacter hankyongi]MCG2620461.1 hypothetical protein [Arthrobacter hankyongi]
MAGEILGFDELAGQRAELLPNRETLFFDINVAPVVGVNLAFAINAATIGSVAHAGAWQDIVSMTR